MMLNEDVRKSEGVGQMRTPGDRGERGRKRGHFLRTFFMDDHLVVGIHVVLFVVYLLCRTCYGSC